MRACVHVNAQPFTQESHLLALPQPYITVTRTLTRARMYRYRAEGTHGCCSCGLAVQNTRKTCITMGCIRVHTHTEAHLDKQVMNLNADECLDEGLLQAVHLGESSPCFLLCHRETPQSLFICLRHLETEKETERERGRQTIGENEKGMKNE